MPVLTPLWVGEWVKIQSIQDDQLELTDSKLTCSHVTRCKR